MIGNVVSIWMMKDVSPVCWAGFRDYWNKGYATESVQALLKLGFEELKLHRIRRGNADNIGSARVMEAGMRRRVILLKTALTGSAIKNVVR